MTRTKPEIKKAAPKEEPIAAWNIHPKSVKAPHRWVKILMTVVQWVAVAAVLLFLFRGVNYRIPERRIMPGYLVILSGVSFAFAWVDIMKWGVSRPWNCITCLSGWFSLLLAFVFHTHFWYVYLGLGCFAGYLFTTIRMKWL